MEQVENYHAFMQLALEKLRAKGWLQSRANIAISTSETGTGVSHCYLYPKLVEDDGSTFDLTGVYFRGNILEDSPRYARELVDEIPSVAEERNRELFNALSTVREKAERAGLPADFINPLTALAEQLASNALFAPRKDEEIF